MINHTTVLLLVLALVPFIGMLISFVLFMLLTNVYFVVYKSGSRAYLNTSTPISEKEKEKKHNQRKQSAKKINSCEKKILTKNSIKKKKEKEKKENKKKKTKKKKPRNNERL